MPIYSGSYSSSNHATYIYNNVQQKNTMQLFQIAKADFANGRIKQNLLKLWGKTEYKSPKIVVSSD
jgi:hypothetical protein